MPLEAKYEFAHLQIGEIFFHRDDKYQKTSESSAAPFVDDAELGTEQLFFRQETVFPEDESAVKR